MLPASRFHFVSRYVPFAALTLLLVLPSHSQRWLPVRLQDGLTIFFGIILEALPFIVLGALASALIRRWISRERLLRLVPHQPFLAYLAIALLGLALPVCECGNLPVARRLIRQGMRPAQALTFYLAAPIVNPAVILSTAAAFRQEPGMVWARTGIGFLIAIGIGLYFHWCGDDNLLAGAEISSCEHQDGMLEELVEMLAALGLGAVIATVVQLVLPRAGLLALGHAPVAAIGAMMLLAAVVSLCSTVDAFFALSFTGIFSGPALLAFLLVGPTVDFRTITLAARGFSPKTIAVALLLVAELVFLACLGLQYGGFL
jgi:uncharacterized membrane protein YraQ (UPF0718 family)